jgi:hypothetical protein
MDGNELVRKMIEAFDEHYGEDLIDLSRRMAAAAKVCIDEALGEPTREENAVMYRTGTNCHDDLAKVLRDRKALLLTPKTAEERVTVGMNRDGWFVSIDGVEQQDKLKEGIAKAARCGLIAELKEQGL